MWIVRLALRRPYTIIVFALVILLMTPIVISRTPVDIFPNIDIPVIAIAWNYTGLPPEQMEQRIVTNYERFLTTVVDNIDHIESQIVAGRAVTKVYFHPGVNVPLSMSEVVASAQSIVHSLPPGIGAPLIVSYSASSVPVLQLGMKGPGIS